MILLWYSALWLYAFSCPITTDKINKINVDFDKFETEKINICQTTSIPDEDDPEYIRQLMRPVEVKEDVRQMAERKRVKLVLESRLFRDELEDLVVEQMMQNGSPLTPNSISIQRLSDFLAPRVKTAIGNGGFVW